MQNNLSNFEEQFKRSTSPMLVLQLLSEEDMYAYVIIQKTLQLSDGVYKMPLLYTSLNKLKDQGYVEESRQEISEDNRVRIYYAITERGTEYLALLKASYKRLSDSVSEIIFKETSICE